MRTTEPVVFGDESRARYDAAIAVQNRRAVQVVASQATDTDDCVELLAMLGLTAPTR
ncbi:MAG: hypothetical protein ACT4O0_05960 [Pseudonocardia sp.]|jgi:hypothetical protein